MTSNYLHRIQSYMILSLIALVVVTCTAIQPAAAHPWAITECTNNIIYTEADLMHRGVYGNTGFYAEGYDTNNDHEVDVLALSHITEYGKGTQGLVVYEHDPNPVFWIVDRDYDGFPDEKYIDIHGEGDCDDIVPYDDMTDPAYGKPDYDNKEGATI